MVDTSYAILKFVYHISSKWKCGLESDLGLLPLDRDFSYSQYGHKLENGSWTGIVGDLISGEIDISVATLTMTTEREEVGKMIT